MGARLASPLVMRPSIDAAEIETAMDAVGRTCRLGRRDGIRAKIFEGIFDIERLLSKITIGTASPRELISLRSSMGCLPRVADCHR